MAHYQRGVPTTNGQPYQPGTEYCVIAPQARYRTWDKKLEGSIDHATNLIAAGHGDEFLVAKVVARVKRHTPPVKVEKVR